MKTFDLNIFRKANGIAIANAIIEMFEREVYFRNAFMEIPKARIITKRNHNRITSFHLYFIRMKIIANASAKENTIDRKFVVTSPLGVSNPKGSSFPGAMPDSPVAGLIIVCGV